MEPVTFALPDERLGSRWQVELSTSDPGAGADDLAAGARLPLEAHSAVVLSRVGPPAAASAAG
jgi:hypothetical protein